MYENGKLVVNEEKTSYKTLAFDIALSGEYTFDVSVYNINDGNELGSKEFIINIDLVGEGNIDNEYETESVRTFTIKDGEKINIWPSGIYTYCWPSDEGEDWVEEAPSITDAGSLKVMVKATNPYYKNTIVKYTLMVFKRIVNITSESASKYYDGTPLSNSSLIYL